MDGVDGSRSRKIRAQRLRRTVAQIELVEGLAETAPLGQTAAHPVRWEGEKMISEYEYHVGGAYHLVRRTMVAKGEGAYQWTIEDLADDKVTVVIDITGTRLDK